MEINGPDGPLGVAIALVVSLGVVGFGVYSYVGQAQALDDTETVSATIVETAIDSDTHRGDTDYTPSATFTYTYEGSTYTTTNLYPGPVSKEFDTRQAAQDALSGLETGASTTAYVPVDAPRKAFLTDTRSNKPLVFIVLGLLVGGVTVVQTIRN